MTKPSRNLIERPAGELGIASPLAHRLDDCERAERKRGKWSFRAASNNHISEIVADVTQRFANGNGAAGATVRVCCADAAKAKFNCDVGMGGAAKDLQRQSLIDAARSFFQKMRMLIFRVGDTAESGSETNADAMLRLFARIFEPGIFQRELG